MNAYSYVVFNLTNKCNTVCRYCFQDSSPKNNQFLPSEVIKNCLDYCLPKADSKPFAQFTGGEIFLHPNIWDILKYAKNKGWNLRLQTNGLTIERMTSEQLAFLSQKGITLKISLDGYDQETHEQMRAKGTFSRIIAGIETIKAYKPRYCIKAVLTPQVATEFQKMLELSLSIEAAGISYNMMRPEGRATNLDNLVDEFSFTKKAIELFNQDKYRHLLNGSKILGIWMQKQIDWEAKSFYINCDGSVYPSQNINSDEYVGNVIKKH